MRRHHTAGFTLVEMMVVVVILGILATLAVATISPKTRPIDVASEFATLVGDASRLAIRGGPVRSDVAISESSKRRSRIVGSVSGMTVAFTLEVLVEEDGVALPRWDVVRGLAVPTAVTAEDFAIMVGARANVPLFTDWDNFMISCFPNGSCSAASLFFSASRGATGDRQARISVLPLGSATFIRNDWN